MLEEIITIPIEGISPILMNNGASMLAEKPTGAHRQHIPSPEEEAEASVYRLPEGGQLFMPMLAFRSATLGAAKGRRLGKNYLTSLVAGNVFAEDVPAPLVDSEGAPIISYIVDSRRCVLPQGTHPSVIRSRPKVFPWETEVVFSYDPEAIPEKVIVELVDIAGHSVGVGNFRPEKKGRFGRWQVKI